MPPCPTLPTPILTTIVVVFTICVDLLRKTKKNQVSKMQVSICSFLFSGKVEQR